MIDWQSVAISVAKFAKQQELRSFGNMMLEDLLQKQAFFGFASSQPGKF